MTSDLDILCKKNIHILQHNFANRMHNKYSRQEYSLVFPLFSNTTYRFFVLHNLPLLQNNKRKDW